MSSEHDVQLSSGSKAEPQKQSKISFSRDFLLSLSDLDPCKNLPSVFDASILSEFEDALFFTNESQRSKGSTLHSSRIADCGSLLPNREGFTSYSRGIPGRWEVRSAVSINRNGEQADRGTSIQDSAKRFGTQPQRPSLHTGQDGLLGSGSFSRPSGYVGYSSPRGRGTSHFLLSRTTEPYQPPRPYKAVPFQRKSYADSRNDETFSSADCTGEDRIGEQKRRESFELMRKEQQKSLHEKQREILDNQKEKLTADVVALSDSSIGKKIVSDMSDKIDDSSLVSQNDSSNLTITRASTSLSICPPGFAGPLLDLNSSTSSSNIPAAEDMFNRMEENQKIDISSDIMVSPSNSNSILEKLFGSAISSWEANCSENELPETDQDTLLPVSYKSSKFADWFLEDKKSAEDCSSKNLVDLIVNNDIVASPSSVLTDDKLIEQVQPILLFETKDMKSELYDPSPTSSKVEISEHQCQANKLDPNSGILTCEDLEQLILAKVKDSTFTLHSEDGHVAPTSGRNEKQKVDADDHASQHLYFLPNKTKKEGNMASVASPKLDNISFDKGESEKVNCNVNFRACDESSCWNYDTAPNIDRTRTLEALFGAAFLNELKYSEAPVSSQRDLDDVIKRTASASLQQPDFVYSSLGNSQYEKSMHEAEICLNHNHGANAPYKRGPDVNPGNSLVEGLKHCGNIFRDQALRIHLPKEDGLFSVSDPLLSVSYDPLPFASAKKTEFLPNYTMEQLGEKMHDAYLRDSVSTLPLNGLTHGSSQDLLLPDSFYHHVQGTSSQLPHLSYQMRPSLPDVDHLTNRNQQMNFLGPHTIRNDFILNIAPHVAPSHAGVPQYDGANAMHNLRLTRMSTPGKFSPGFPVQAFQRGITSSHPVSHMQNIPEMNNAHNFSFYMHQNSGDLGMRMAGPLAGAIGGNDPESFQRMINLQLRANAKQVHPATAGCVPAIYSTDSGRIISYR